METLVIWKEIQHNEIFYYNIDTIETKHIKEYGMINTDCFLELEVY